MFAETIKEERRNLSHTQFASAINTSKESVIAWENGRLPQISLLNRLAKEFNWSHDKLRRIAEWVEDERERRKEEKELKDSLKNLKACAFDQISNVVLNGSGSLSDIDMIVRETTEVIEEDLNGRKTYT